MNALRLLWFGALVLYGGVFIFYSVGLPLFGDRLGEAWEWLLPNLIAPVGLVFGLNLAANANTRDRNATQAAASNQGKWIGSMWFANAASFAFIVALGVSVFSVLGTTAPIEFLEMTNYWLVPLLGLAMAMIGAVLGKPDYQGA